MAHYTGQFIDHLLASKRPTHSVMPNWSKNPNFDGTVFLLWRALIVARPTNKQVGGNCLLPRARPSQVQTQVKRDFKGWMLLHCWCTVAAKRKSDLEIVMYSRAMCVTHGQLALGRVVS